MDASPEVLAINRRRVGRPDVRYVVADLFGWSPELAPGGGPEHGYDVVFFSFWLSHVPRARFGLFWGLVGSLLRPGGRAFLIDNRRDPTWSRPDPYVVDEGADVQRRRLGDGSEHRVVKVFYEPGELVERLSAEGWRAEITDTRWFIYGSARPEHRDAGPRR